MLFHEALLTWYTGIWDSYKIGLYCIVVRGSSKLLIAGQELEVIAAPICAPLQVAVYWNEPVLMPNDAIASKANCC
jgi:hypothetical protein